MPKGISKQAVQDGYTRLIPTPQEPDRTRRKTICGIVDVVIRPTLMIMAHPAQLLLPLHRLLWPLEKRLCFEPCRVAHLRHMHCAEVEYDLIRIVNLGAPH